MSCTCDFDDMATFFREAYHTARKQHTCCECASPIDPGERYQYVSGLWDGRFSTYKTCMVCAIARDNAIMDGCCSELGNLWAETGVEYE